MLTNIAFDLIPISLFPFLLFNHHCDERLLFRNDTQQELYLNKKTSNYQLDSKKLFFTSFRKCKEFPILFWISLQLLTVRSGSFFLLQATFTKVCYRKFHQILIYRYSDIPIFIIYRENSVISKCYCISKPALPRFTALF